MTRFYRAIFLAIVVLLSGCMKENRDDCPDPVTDPNLIIYFTYTDANNGKDIFHDRVDQVELVLFDANENFYGLYSIPSQELNEFQGKKLVLPAGVYYAICWGNIKDRSELGELTYSTTFEDSFLQHYSSDKTDELHYAPSKLGTRADDNSSFDDYLRIVVPEDATKEHYMEFMPAFRTINVYVKGYYNATIPAATEPNILITDLASRYDYYLNTTGDAINFFQSSKMTRYENEDWAKAGFTTPHFPNENDIEIHILNPVQNTSERSVELQKILEDEGIELYDGDCKIIDVFIDYTTMNVTVKAYDWKKTSVNPIL